MAGSKRPPIVSREQIRAAFEADGKFGVIVSTPEVADLIGISAKTLDEWVDHGLLDGTFRKRGKHRLFWRDKVLDIIFNGPEWPTFAKRQEKARRKRAERSSDSADQRVTDS